MPSFEPPPAQSVIDRPVLPRSPSMVRDVVGILISLTFVLAADRPAIADVPAGERQRRIADYLTGAVFVGSYVDDDTPTIPKKERYEIARCELMEPADDRYRMTVRIRYGERDATVPIIVRIPVADRTPVITVDQTWVPGMGTFDARVVIDRRPEGSDQPDRYAGTWSAGDHGGQLFGTIERASDRAETGPGTATPDPPNGGSTDLNAANSNDAPPARP